MASLSNLITTGNNDRVEIKSQANLNGQAFKVFKMFKESLKIVEQAIKIEEINMSSQVGVWGNPDYGVWGTMKWASSSTQLSTTLLRVIPPSRKFRENFRGNYFVNLSSTTCTIDTSNNYARFTNGEQLVSNIIYKNSETINSAVMNLNISSGADNLSSYISCDNGSNFTEVTNNLGNTISIANTGEDVIYKIRAHGDARVNLVEVTV